MAPQDNASFGQALDAALKAKRMTQAALAAQIHVDAAQVSRWKNGKARPHIDTVRQIEEILEQDLLESFEQGVEETYELYVSAPIIGVGPGSTAAHHDKVAQVVSALDSHVNTVYWPGREIRELDDLDAPDLVAERNLDALSKSETFLYIQMSEITRPTSALVELGIALGRRTKTTLIFKSGIDLPFMLDGFSGVAAGLQFMPKARIYIVDSVEDACELLKKSGRAILGLD